MKTILVVDDEFGVAEALRDVLVEEGFDVAIAHNGKDGLRRLDERRADLVLVNYMMPVMDGREMLLALRADPGRSAIPVVMMSALPRASLPEDCASATFLRKPFAFEALLAEIRKQLGATV